jgi:sec-independent protein translocase protein TatB
MPSFQDSIVLFVIALLLFGPKKLPVLARELGKWIGEFRRASNEFKMQMEEELRLTEQADRQKQISAMEAAAPVTPPLPEPEHPHTSSLELDANAAAVAPIAESSEPSAVSTTPLPIATSGELDLMPPATGLPTPRNGRSATTSSDALGGLIDSIPEVHTAPALSEIEEPRENALHGD